MSERTSYAPGTFSWVELVTSDADAAKAFYTEAFGWDYLDSPVGDGMVYSTALVDGKAVGALFASTEQPPSPGPPAWLPYVGHADADGLHGRIGDLGGRALSEVMSIGPGRIAILADPQGGVFAVWSGDYN